MRKLVIAICALLSFFGVSCQAQEAFRSVDVAEFELAVADESYVVLDVRTPEEHAEGHISGTDFNINVLDDGFVAEALAVLPKDKSVALYCRSGNRSKRAAKILAENGYDVVELATGYNGWVAAGK
ncbi:MAG: rhodanese-like domain-containing protein [Alistipes sp.]|nr:rhodanese-like domain-containing protein [Alistipes sp.]